MTGTYSRHRTNETGQLKGLEARVSDKAMERRTAKIATRVGRDGAITRGALVQFLSMGFYARLRWLLTGKLR